MVRLGLAFGVTIPVCTFLEMFVTETTSNNCLYEGIMLGLDELGEVRGGEVSIC